MLSNVFGRLLDAPNRKRTIPLFILAVSFLAASFVPAADEVELGIKTVVIDPGHGGKDSGCLGASHKEKDIALAIGLKLGKFIEENYKDVNVIYTRKTDVFVELHERAKIANDAKADLFICIHANSGSAKAHGTETYVMGMHKLDANLKVAQRENASILLEEDHALKYDGFDPNSAESYIIFSLYQSAFVEQSARFAAKIQAQFTDLGRKNRGVKQAGFLVLYRTTMPSVLIETGFLTNKEEEEFLSNPTNQDKMAGCIYSAFEEYKAEVESTMSDDPPKPSPKPEQSDPPKTHGTSLYGAPKASDEDKAADATLTQGLVYRIQIASSSKKLNLKAKNFNGLENVAYTEDKASDRTIYRYYYGKAETFEASAALKQEARDKGYPDAFVKPFYNGERISLEKALELEKSPK